MKKILLASTLALSMTGIVKTSVLADESQATNKFQATEETIVTDVVKDKEEQKKTDTESHQTTEKIETPPTSNQSSTEAIVEDVHQNGWQKDNDNWRYYEDNKPVLNWKQIAGVWYYFNQDGIMLSNTIYKDYLLNKSGALAERSWVKLAEQWYYADEKGKVTRDKWEKIAGAWYRFDQKGTMLNNTIYKEYLFSASGALAESSWVKISNKWYYGDQEGKIARDKWEKVKDSWYYFNKDGIMLSETIYKDHLFNKNGALAESSWVKLGNKWYYADASGKILKDKWEKIKDKWYHFNADGVMESSVWKKKYYLKDNGAMAQNEWIFDKKHNSWFYLTSDGSYAENQWQGVYYLKSYGYMAKNEWIFDKSYNAWYYLKEDGVYVTGTFKIKGKDYTFQSNGKWISNTSKHYKVTPLFAYVYSASGDKLTYISQGTVVSVADGEGHGGRIPVQISGVSGYMNKSDLVEVNASSSFIPHYTSDGNFLYHELSAYASYRVARHSSVMEIGKKYYSTDGKNFDNFSIENPFLFRDLSKPTNYTAEELDKIFSVMNIQGSPFAGKGAIFKEAEKRYGINALYLMAHSALESSWGRSQIARDKNNFFGIAAYDSSPYQSAKSFDNVDKGILGAAKWIRQNYYDQGRTYLGNKASGMNVIYASDPYWGEKIASIMMTINSRLGEKD